jgi:hypothetical protein
MTPQLLFIVKLSDLLSYFDIGEEVREERLASSLCQMFHIQQEEQAGICAMLISGGPKVPFVFFEPGHPETWSDPRCTAILALLESRAIPLLLISTYLPNVSELPPHHRSDFRGWTNSGGLRYWKILLGLEVRSSPTHKHLGLFTSHAGNIYPETIEFFHEHVRDDPELLAQEDPVVFLTQICEKSIRVYCAKLSEEGIPGNPEALLRIARNIAFAFSNSDLSIFTPSDLSTAISEEDQKFFPSLTHFFENCPIFINNTPENPDTEKKYNLQYNFRSYLTCRHILEQCGDVSELKKFIASKRGTSFERIAYCWLNFIIFRENPKIFPEIFDAFFFLEPRDPDIAEEIQRWLLTLELTECSISPEIITKISEIVESELRRGLLSDDPSAGEWLRWCFILKRTSMAVKMCEFPKFSKILLN